MVYQIYTVDELDSALSMDLADCTIEEKVREVAAPVAKCPVDLT